MKTFFAKTAVKGCLILGLVAAFPTVPYMLPDAQLAALQQAPKPGQKRMTVADRMTEFGAQARSRLAPDFDLAGIAYPPKEAVLVGLKQERILELYAKDGDDRLHFIKSYKFAASTGTLGPKLVEGDRQMPEGLYRLEYLNPNSVAHVSLKIGYPNAFEVEQAKADGRSNPGSDIMIHGKTGGSQGCVALNDRDVEEIFTLTRDIGLSNVSVLLSPVDLRTTAAPELKNAPDWIGRVYSNLSDAMAALPPPRIQVASD